MSFNPGGSSSGNIHTDGDVALSNPADGQVLTYTASVSKWQNQSPTTTDSTKLAIANNLSDLASVSTARTNLGLGTAATTASSAYDAAGAATTAQAAAIAASLQKANNLSDVTTPATARTNLGLGTAATISSTAGGDLSGTLPSPTVAKVNGVAVTGTPTAGQVITASSGTAAAWSTPAAGAGNATTSSTGTIQLAGDLAGTATTPSVAKINGTSVPATPTAGQVLTATSGTAATWSTPATTGAQALTATAVKTSAYTASPGDLVPVDTTSAAVTITLPTAPVDKTRIAIKKIDATTNMVSVVVGGSDVFNKASGSTTVTLATANQMFTLQYAATGAIWYVADGPSLGALDTRYVLTTAEAVAGGVATLDSSGLVPTSQLPLSTQTITISGTGAPSNAAGQNGDTYIDYASGNVYAKVSGAWGTAVTTLEPSATTSAKGLVQLAGDLSGTAAAPTVAKVNGITLPSSAPTSGQVLSATSGTATAWTTLNGSSTNATTSAPGLIQLAGDLGGSGTTATVPVIASIQGVVISGTPASGQVLTASSSTAASWAAASSGSGTASQVVSKTANYTAANGDIVFANGTFTITSPAATLGYGFTVKNTGTGTITVSPSSGTLDGASSFTLVSQYDSFRFVCDGTNWGVF